MRHKRSNIIAPHIESQGTLAQSLSKKRDAMKPTFLTKKQREELALQKLQQKREEDEKKREAAQIAHERFVSGQNEEDRRRKERLEREKLEREKRERRKEENKEDAEHDSEVKAIREHYLGGAEKKRKITKPSDKFARIFKFDWDAEEDTGRNDLNPLYNDRAKINPLFGRGYIAGMDQKEQRKDSNYLETLSMKRVAEAQQIEAADDQISEAERRARAQARDQAIEEFKRRKTESLRAMDEDAAKKVGLHWSEKSLTQMTDRDWRIFREDFDIRVQGGRATLPLRNWEEGNLPREVMQAIQAVNYDKPSPIQRQAIPIGVSKRDLIGIAETGSGKTAAFIIPLLCYLLQLPRVYIDRCHEQGPLSVIMAPVRELAQQIQKEAEKLAQFTGFTSLAVVGGETIEDQGYKLRKGVQILIGTPGRMVDLMQQNYLVLNQCNYVVMDEADRMLDMGFGDQVITILDAMGGLLKSEDEEMAEKQLQETQHSAEASGAVSTGIFRVTAMYSATMAPGIEQIARSYLRHPVMIRIGDEDSGKNKRIEQRVLFLSSENQKKNKLIEEVHKLSVNDKAIIFVNSKKSGDTLSWQLEQLGRRCGVLHGGKSQDQREESLDQFRAGKIQLLVATDVAGRGLDIPDVSFVFNYDCPQKIAPYCHRIGRTGRAGKYGVATTFITDADTEIMYDLKAYLESTDTPVPSQLARHPAAQAPLGSRDDKGKLLGVKKDAVMYAK